MSAPSYQELADVLVALTEHVISNLNYPGNEFVTCYTYGKKIPPVYRNAMKLRSQLGKEKIVEVSETRCSNCFKPFMNCDCAVERKKKARR
jgi:hypothetical protein